MSDFGSKLESSMPMPPGMSRLGYAHLLGRYTFPEPGEGPRLRPLRDPAAVDD